jgi:hypothetical protein
MFEFQRRERRWSVVSRNRFDEPLKNIVLQT